MTTYPQKSTIIPPLVIAHPRPRPTITTATAIATMLQQLSLLSKFCQTGPVPLAPSISRPHLRIPKSVLLHCTAAARHTTIRACARRVRVMPLAQFEHYGEMRVRSGHRTIGQVLNEDTGGAKQKTLIYPGSGISQGPLPRATNFGGPRDLCLTPGTYLSPSLYR